MGDEQISESSIHLCLTEGTEPNLSPVPLSTIWDVTLLRPLTDTTYSLFLIRDAALLFHLGKYIWTHFGCPRSFEIFSFLFGNVWASIIHASVQRSVNLADPGSN